MYQVSIEAFNNATLTVIRSTSPTVFDDSVPQAGFVAEGLDFVTDVAWWGESAYMGILNFCSNIISYVVCIEHI